MAVSKQEFDKMYDTHINYLGDQRAELVVNRKTDGKPVFRTEVSMPKNVEEIVFYRGISEEEISKALADSAIKAYESFFNING